MRRILFTVLASCVVLAAVPAIATAHGDEHHRGRHHEHHNRREHARRHHHRARVRHEHFNSDRGDRGDDPGQPGTAGTVTSFTDGVLTITLTNGNTVTGQVTQGTELKCEMQEPEFRDDDQGPAEAATAVVAATTVVPGVAITAAMAVAAPVQVTTAAITTTRCAPRSRSE